MEYEELPEKYVILQNKIKSQDNDIFTTGKNKGKKFNEVLKDPNYNNFIIKKDNLKSSDILQYKEYLADTKILNDKLLSI